MEYIIDSYYNKNNKVNSKKFVDPFNSTCIGIEYWLSKEIFRNDISRIIYATDDNAFRKRIQLLDKNKNFDEELKAETLDLPYGVYSVAGDAEADDIDSSKKSATNSVTGIYFPEEDLNMRRLPVMQKYKAVLFFNDHQSLRQAYQMLLWEKEPEYPIFFYNRIVWRNHDIDLPVFIKIDDLKSNSSEYQETDWLTKHEIYTITMEFTVRTCQLLINNVDKICQLPMRFSNYIDTYEEDEEHPEYFTEQVVLNWVGQKFHIDTNTDNIDQDSDEFKMVKKVFDKTPYNTGIPRIPNDFTIDTITSYFEDTSEVGLKICSWSEEESTQNSVKINIQLENAEKTESVTLFIPTYKPLEITRDQIIQNKKYIVRYLDLENYEIIEDVTDSTEEEIQERLSELNPNEEAEYFLRENIEYKKDFTLDYEGLSENSNYEIDISVKSTSGKIKFLKLRASTKEDPASKAPKKNKINYAAGLMGMHSY